MVSSGQTHVGETTTGMRLDVHLNTGSKYLKLCIPSTYTNPSLTIPGIGCTRNTVAREVPPPLAKSIRGGFDLCSAHITRCRPACSRVRSETALGPKTKQSPSRHTHPHSRRREGRRGDGVGGDMMVCKGQWKVCTAECNGNGLPPVSKQDLTLRTFHSTEEVALYIRFKSCY